MKPIATQRISLSGGPRRGTFPRSTSRVRTSIAPFRRALSAFDVEVRLLVPRYGLEADAPGIVRVPGRRLPFDPEDRLVRLRAMDEAARREAAECDLVHIQTTFAAHRSGLHAARAFGRPTLLTYHTFIDEYLHNYAPVLPASAFGRLAATHPAASWLQRRRAGKLSPTHLGCATPQQLIELGRALGVELVATPV